jgi:hypothetical protein
LLPTSLALPQKALSKNQTQPTKKIEINKNLFPAQVINALIQ